LLRKFSHLQKIWPYLSFLVFTPKAGIFGEGEMPHTQVRKLLILSFVLLLIPRILLKNSGHQIIKAAEPQKQNQFKTTDGGNQLIDDFEGANSPSPWTFSNGPEFPGATGSLSSGVGYHGKGAHLFYDFRPGGNYVSANLRLPAMLSGDAIAFRARTPAGARVTLRINDAADQVLEYRLWRPLEATDVNAWYQQTVRLDAPTSHYGGADDGILHKGIVGVSILVEPVAQSAPGPFGSLDFDEVTLINSIRSDLDPFNALITPAPAGSASLMANLGVNIHFPVAPEFNIDTRALDAARDAGCSWVRMDLFWTDIEISPGVYSFSNFDKLVTALEARGMKPLFILDYASLLHSDCPTCPDWFLYGPESQQTIKAFGDYAEAVARHFAGRGVRYEVWNEPNLSVFWRPMANASQYAALAREAIARVHLGDSSALVVTAGLSGFDYGYLTSLLNLGGAESADAVAIHPYRQLGPETAADELATMKSIVATTFSIARPIWNTEWGYSSSWFSNIAQSTGDGSTAYARNRQAVMVVREVLSSRLMGFPFASYYDIRDDGMDPLDPEQNFGLIANDYSDKPAITALRTLKMVAANRILVGTLATQPSNLHALRLDGASNTVVIVWSDLPAMQASLSLPLEATAMDMYGGVLSLPVSNGRALVTLSESTGPVYVSVPGTSNAIDDSRFFLIQHYRDFLNREPDQSGLEFWMNEMTSCGTDAACIQSQRLSVSAAFVLSIEFQQTGYLVERMYQTAYGSTNGVSTLGGTHTLQAPIVRFNEFLPDAQRIGQGVVVGQTGWETVLESNKQAFALEFVQRSRFTTAFPTTMTPAQFVDDLNLNAGVVLSASERTTAINFFDGAASTTNETARAQALRLVAENQNLVNAEFNRAFVLMEYFGYLRRDPNAMPDSDYTGYDFWLQKLNAFNGNFLDAEMVKAFLSSLEYRQRFRP
jgi:hypothetical protein